MDLGSRDLGPHKPKNWIVTKQQTNEEYVPRPAFEASVKNPTPDLTIRVIPTPPLWIGSIKRCRIHVCQVCVRLMCEG